mmetsp:Transcript_28567/g.61517  ORF Transcript_28567/g.61517 Transcript_28567/m.61517 type:complete len:627 (+) Transcript_28567:133-2013(+)
MKKNCFFSTVCIAFVTFFLSCIYATISAVSLLKKWDDSKSITNSHQADQLTYLSTKVKQYAKPGTNIPTLMKRIKGYYDPLVDRPIHLESNEQISPLPIIVRTMQRYFPQIQHSNATTTNNDGDSGISTLDSTKILEREQWRVLEVLMDHYSKTPHPIDSDVVELRHCRLHMINYFKFSSWASVILQDAWPKIERKLRRNAEEVKGLGRKDDWDDDMYREFCFGLLEIFATHSHGGGKNGQICEFDKYSLKIQRGDLLSAELILRNASKSLSSNTNLPRLVFVIVAFQDADHLEALIKACFMPHHLIIVHLERRSPLSFTKSVRQIEKQYENVAVVQFGSIIYQTDSVSTVNYQIMNWVTEELNISYDYWLTLGNAAYPLLGAEELTNYFLKSTRDIWLGELRNNNNNGGWVSWAYLERKRLVFTMGEQKYTQRTKKWKQNGLFESPIPDYIKTNMTEKTNSGNQAVFSYKVVKKLIASPQVKELFGIAKYGCCCCLEERTWIAAARIIGHGAEAMEAASMFQVWGGEPKCGNGSMKNALLKPNATICYKSEDLTKQFVLERHSRPNDSRRIFIDDVEHTFFRGDKLLEELRLAKQQGVLFARKFKSSDRESLELIEMIKRNIHNN